MIRKFTTRWQLGATLVLSAAAFVRLDGAPQIPLCAGLTIVTAISQSTGDYESIKTVESVTANEIRLKYSSEMPFEDWLTGENGIAKTMVHRRVRQTDLQSATSY